jgi:hypothetical protein
VLPHSAHTARCSSASFLTAPPAELVDAKLLTRATYSLSGIEGPVSADKAGAFTFKERDGMDYAAITLQAPAPPSARSLAPRAIQRASPHSRPSCNDAGSHPSRHSVTAGGLSTRTTLPPWSEQPAASSDRLAAYRVELIAPESAQGSERSPLRVAASRRHLLGHSVPAWVQRRRA